MGANPHANGGRLLRDLKMPDFRDYAVAVPRPGIEVAEATRIMGAFVRDVITLNSESRNFRVVGPDETASNRLTAVFDVTERVSTAEIWITDDHISPDGRVMEVLSEHLCQGWLEGYLLTGRHGLFSCYEAFIHIDSMFNQHAKWLKVTRDIPWRRPIASLNYLLTSHVWRQDHNGFTHQDPGFIDLVMNKTADIVRVYLPPDTNTLLSVNDHCLRSRHYVNVIIAGKQPVKRRDRACESRALLPDVGLLDDGVVGVAGAEVLAGREHARHGDDVARLHLRTARHDQVVGAVCHHAAAVLQVVPVGAQDVVVDLHDLTANHHRLA